MIGRFCAAFPPGNTYSWMLWHYQTDADAADLMRPRHFDDLARRWDVRAGDWIACNLSRGGGVGYDALLLIVQSVGQAGVVVERIGQPAALMKGRELTDAEIEDVIAGETVRRSA